MNIFRLGHICLLCHQFTRTHYDLCTKCEQDLPLNYTKDYVAPFDYNFPVDHMITQLKFNENLLYAKLLGTLLAKKISLHYENSPHPTLIIPVPLHKKRLQERGFNQALEIAKTVSAILKIKINTTSCLRKKHTTAQSSLNASERKENIKHSFELIHPISAAHIAILDDVITTGETVKALANTISPSGAIQIDFWSCAYTSI